MIQEMTPIKNRKPDSIALRIDHRSQYSSTGYSMRPSTVLEFAIRSVYRPPCELVQLIVLTSETCLDAQKGSDDDINVPKVGSCKPSTHELAEVRVSYLSFMKFGIRLLFRTGLIRCPSLPLQSFASIKTTEAPSEEPCGDGHVYRPCSSFGPVARIRKSDTWSPNLPGSSQPYLAQNL